MRENSVFVKKIAKLIECQNGNKENWLVKSISTVEFYTRVIGKLESLPPYTYIYILRQNYNRGILNAAPEITYPRNSSANFYKI